MQEALVTMLRMQDRMNTRVHPQWREQEYAWHRAIWIESAELVDHHGYKWWKHQKPDLGQVQMEAVDIWHFGMSSLLMKHEGDSKALAAEIERAWRGSDGASGVVEAAELVAGIAAKDHRFDVPAFAALCAAAELSFDELYKQYLGKNVLNFFRQDNGYKDGSYRKEWAGREDNEHLMELLSDVDPSAADAEESLYTALEARYAATG
ncbi:MAG: dUTP diphosphatase [Pseudomonadota bacterium]